MKKTLLKITVVVFSMFLFSCQENVEVSPEMQGFIDNLDGSPHDLKNALHEFGADNLIEDDNISSVDLSDPKVISCTGDKDHNCYEFEAKAGKKRKRYEICWDGKQIESMHSQEISRQ